MEIKVGDKVRVREDAPEMCFYGCNYDNSVCKVILVDRDNAVITQVKNGSFVIPTKYLTKVDAEEKEPKFKVGDVVRIKPNADKLHQGYQNGYAWLPERDNYLGRVASVKEIWCGGSMILNIQDNLLWEPIDLEPYTEPTEENKPTDLTKEVANNLSNALEGCCNAINNIANNFDWDTYTADLAKEIAVKLSDPNENKPGYVADYAVSVAKAVVENLKKK